MDICNFPQKNTRSVIGKIEKATGLQHEAAATFQDIQESLHIQNLSGLRILQRYDIEGLNNDAIAKARFVIFTEPPTDNITDDALQLATNETAYAVEYLPGQFDQRADSAAQCARSGTRVVAQRDAGTL